MQGQKMILKLEWSKIEKSILKLHFLIIPLAGHIIQQDSLGTVMLQLGPSMVKDLKSKDA